jgi:hypothetical protein
MRRLVYVCPEDTRPTGGIKVIYRHVEVLNRMGIPACVLHPYANDFRYQWSEHVVPYLDRPQLDPGSDYAIIAEVLALNSGRECRDLNIPYALFVQNGYFMYPESDQDRTLLLDVVHGADLILSISADTDRMLRLNFPMLDPARLVRAQFAVADHFRVRRVSPWVTDVPAISYMPRKLPLHSRQVVYALRPYLPAGWQIQPIDNVDEKTCATMLRRSKIFLSFSEFEGLPLPPLEAALAGNMVIGYTGQGGAQYWAEPNFRLVAQGDIFGFVDAARSAANQIEAGLFGPDVLAPGIAKLADEFSPAAEAESLRMISHRIAERGEGTRRDRP